MEPISLGIGIIALASLFSTCIECFDYFRLGQKFDEDLEILLVQMDLEKFRLLDWGNTVGVLRISKNSGRISGLETTRKEIISSCLRQIANLLTNTENLQSKYGARTVTTNEGKGGRLKALPSLNSMNIFKTLYRRFCVRFANRPSQIDTLLSKTKWAIRDKAKFEGLKQNLKGFIDGLYEILPISREIQDQTFGDDIALFIDISKLRLIEIACEESYRTWSSKASEVIRESESGTIDRRSVEERIRDAEFIREPGDPSSTVKSELLVDTSFELPYGAKAFFVFTEQCSTVHPETLCDPYELGNLCFGKLGFQFNANCRNRWNLGQRIADSIKLSELTYADIDTINAQTYKPELDKNQIVPLGTVYIYCAPCVRQIHTSWQLCYGSGISRLLSFAVRVDDRVPCSCCPATLGLAGLISLRDKLKETDALSTDKRAECFDQPWIEQRIFAMEEEMFEVQYEESVTNNISRIFSECESERQSRCAGIVILGELIPCSAMLDATPFAMQARKARETDIYQVQYCYNSKIQQWTWERKYTGSYSPRKYRGTTLAIGSTAALPESSKRDQPPAILSDSPQPATSIASSSGSKRRKTSSRISSDPDDQSLDHNSATNDSDPYDARNSSDVRTNLKRQGVSDFVQ